LKIKRRDFIRLLGGVTGGLTLGAYALQEKLNVPSRLLNAAKNGPGITSWKATICGMCPAGCSLKFKLIDGLPIYVKGNRIYPVNNGGVCPLAHGSLEQLFHSERLTKPLVKSGVKGSGNFKVISWNDLFNNLSVKLNYLKNNNTPERFAIIGNNESYLQQNFITSFISSFGSPNYFRTNFLSQSKTPFNIIFGRNELPAYDIINAKTVLTLGANILETGSSPIYYTKLFSSLRSRTKGVANFIHVSPRKDVTGTFANEFVPIKCGTYGAFALGLAYVLIREELIDRNFLNKFTFGFEGWIDKNGVEQKGFKELVLKNYYPERVSKITNVPSEIIIRLGRTLGNNQPSIVIGGEYIDNDVNGFYSQWATQSLNALLGNIGKTGGLLFPHSVPSNIFKFPDNFKFNNSNKNFIKNKFNERSLTGEFSNEQFAENVLTGKPFPIEVLFIYKGDLIFQSGNKNQLKEALRKIPMVVYFGSFVNETAEYADFVVPLPTYMEEWDVIEKTPGVKFPHAGVRQPIVEPFYNLRSMPDLLLKLGKLIKNKKGEYSKYDSYSALVKARLNEIYLTGKGAVVEKQSGAEWLEFIGKRGWHLGAYESFDEFLQLILQKGGWWDPTAQPVTTKRIFNTISKKFEFFSLTLQKLFAEKGIKNYSDASFLHGLKPFSGEKESLFLPVFLPPKAEKEKQLKLFIYSSSVNRDGTTSNIPMLQELFGFSVEYYWNSWVELNPETARKFNIENNDFVWITSDNGSINLKAKIIPAIAEDVLAIPFGLGHKSFGKYAKNYGKNPTEILKVQNDFITGKAALLATNVKIEKKIRSTEYA